MTPADLRRIANKPGYGTGMAARDRLAAERECLKWLPKPDQMPGFFAAPDNPGPLMPVANFGNSEDGRDWCLWHDGRDEQWHPFGDDAADDARIVAAILNAYRLGILSKVTKMTDLIDALREAIPEGRPLTVGERAELAILTRKAADTLERLIEDRSRFPDRPDFIGQMIEANYGNMRAKVDAAERAAERYGAENRRLFRLIDDALSVMKASGWHLAPAYDGDNPIIDERMMIVERFESALNPARAALKPDDVR